MSGRDVLDPSKVNRVVHVILLINVSGLNRCRHFENARVHTVTSNAEVVRAMLEVTLDAKAFHQLLPDLHL